MPTTADPSAAASVASWGGNAARPRRPTKADDRFTDLHMWIQWRHGRCSSVAERLLPKQDMRVRFPSSAPWGGSHLHRNASSRPIPPPELVAPAGSIRVLLATSEARHGKQKGFLEGARASAPRTWRGIHLLG